MALDGAAPPEIKGLADVRFAQFSDDARRAVVIDFDEPITARQTQEKRTMNFNATPSLGIDQKSVAFAEAAQKRANEKNIPYGQALTEIYADDRAAKRIVQLSEAVAFVPGSVARAEAATELAAERGISFGEALGEVAHLDFADAAPPFVRQDGAKREVLIAAVQEGQVVLNAGTAAGLKVGDVLSVQRLNREITDPATGSSLRKIYLPVGDVQITKLDDLSADAEGTSGGGFKVGDVATVASRGD